MITWLRRRRERQQRAKAPPDSSWPQVICPTCMAESGYACVSMREREPRWTKILRPHRKRLKFAAAIRARKGEQDGR